MRLATGDREAIRRDLVGFRDDAERLHTLSFFRSRLAHLLAVLGHTDEARIERRRVYERLGDVPRDLTWLASVAVTIATCDLLKDTDKSAQTDAARFYEWLLPYRDRNITASPWMCFGSASHYLALAADLVGGRRERPLPTPAMPFAATAISALSRGSSRAGGSSLA